MTDATQARIGEIVNGSDVLLFMKGTPYFPQCGFSSRAVAILEHIGVEFGSFDVLQDPEVRAGTVSYTHLRAHETG
jgi:monothiol glutaredoxin